VVAVNNPNTGIRLCMHDMFGVNKMVWIIFIKCPFFSFSQTKICSFTCYAQSLLWSFVLGSSSTASSTVAMECSLSHLVSVKYWAKWS